ncbi:MAG: glycosyltransferase [Bacillota bacterium]
MVIPSYQSKWCIGEAIDSVFAQTYSNYEIIVVDDGSTDGTTEFINKNYENKVRVITQENRGLAAARNSGLESAQGEFVQFLDADDLLLPNKFLSQVQALINYPEIDAIVGDIQETDLISALPKQSRIRNLPDELFPDIIWSNIIGPVHGPMTRMSVIKNIGGFDEGFHNYCADWEFWLTAAYLNCKFRQTHECTGIYRRHNKSLRNHLVYPNTIGDLQVALRAKEYAEVCTRSQNWHINEIIRYRYERAAYWAAIDVNVKKAFEHVLTSVQYAPAHRKYFQIVRGLILIIEAELEKKINQWPRLSSFHRNVRRHLKR